MGTIFFVVISVQVNINLALTHNNVVVIPMAGDEVFVEQTPITPIVNVNTSQQGTYTIGELTVIDNTTNLEWERIGDDFARDWVRVLLYCNVITVAGHDDWHLPTINELMSIVDYGCAMPPLIRQVAFSNIDSSHYWSATTSTPNSFPGNDVAGSARTVNFFNGYAISSFKESEYYVRCVR